MMFPPMAVKVSVQSKQKRGFSLWLPLFIIIPFVLVIFILLLPLAVIAGVLGIIFLVAGGRGGRAAKTAVLVMMAIPLLWTVFCALRGILVDVGSESEHVHVSIR